MMGSFFTLVLGVGGGIFTWGKILRLGDTKRGKNSRKILVNYRKGSIMRVGCQPMHLMGVWGWRLCFIRLSARSCDTDATPPP